MSATRTVYWLNKFGGAAVIIDAAAFDPAVHSDTPWAAAADPVVADDSDDDAAAANEAEVAEPKAAKKSKKDGE